MSNDKNRSCNISPSSGLASQRWGSIVLQALKANRIMISNMYALSEKRLVNNGNNRKLCDTLNKSILTIILSSMLSLFSAINAYAYTPTYEHGYAEPTISQIPGECVPWYLRPGFGDLACGQHYPLPPFHIRMLIANHNSSLTSQGYIEVKFRVPANITNVYFTVAAEVVGNNFTGPAGINTQLYDITECHKTITPKDLQPDGQCGISYLDARGMSAMNGSIGHIRLPAGRNYILVFTNPADGPVQVTHSAYFTYTYFNSTDGEGK